MRQLLQVIKGGLDVEGLSQEAQAMVTITRGNTLEAKLNFVWKDLQGNVDQVLDRDHKTVSGEKVIKVYITFVKLCMSILVRSGWLGFQAAD